MISETFRSSSLHSNHLLLIAPAIAFLVDDDKGPLGNASGGAIGVTGDDDSDSVGCKRTSWDEGAPKSAFGMSIGLDAFISVLRRDEGLFATGDVKLEKKGAPLCNGRTSESIDNGLAGGEV